MRRISHKLTKKSMKILMLKQRKDLKLQRIVGLPPSHNTVYLQMAVRYFVKAD